MRPYAAMLNTVELALVAALAGAGSYAFLDSSAYDAVSQYGARNNIGFMPYLPLIIWSVLTVFGVVSIVLSKRGSGTFIWLVTIFSLPSLLGQNTIDWPGILGLNFKLTTSLGFAGMLAIGIFIITGYIVLDYLRAFKNSEQRLADRGVSNNDIESVSGFSYLALLAAIGGGLAATVVVAFLARHLELLTLDYIRKMPWNIVFIGLFCFLLLAFYLYWLGARRRGRIRGEG